MELLNYLSHERVTVIKNIGCAAAEGDDWRKVEIGDHVVTQEEREYLAARFDNDRRSPAAKIKSYAASRLADALAKKYNKDTVIVGVENAFDIKGGAVITSNHYHPADSTPIRMLLGAIGRKNDLHIMIQEANMFMAGAFGFLMKNCNTHPYIPLASYVTKKFMPSVGRILGTSGMLLVYPEAEMWYNFKRPRKPRDGAYHIASSFGVPILPTFTELITLDGERDENGFLPIRRVLHVLPPIFPKTGASVQESRAHMRDIDYRLKRGTYEQIYNTDINAPFCIERDIAGIVADE